MNIMDRISRIRDYCKDICHTTIKVKYEHRTYDPSSKETKISLYNQDTLKTAVCFKNPLILILADAERPGGTWVSGMQEESLFRRTALFGHMLPDMYPLAPDEALLARHVEIFALDEKCVNLERIIGYGDFIACPGVKSYTGKADRDILCNKIRLILDTAILYGYETVVLGALGCGVFGCNPKQVAIIFKSVLEEYDGRIGQVVFAILGKNYDIFMDVLNE